MTDGGSPVDSDLGRILETHLGTGYPPGYAAAVLTGDGRISSVFGGVAVLDQSAVPPAANEFLRDSSRSVQVTVDTLFDLASLTKVVVTTPLVLLLAQCGVWDLDDRICEHLPAAPDSPVTLRQCLTHTSGLVWHRPYFAYLDTPAAIRAAVVAELGAAELAGADPAGAGIVYSDLNFMLLGWALEFRADCSLDVLATRELFVPLGMSDTCYRPGDARRGSTAATEIDGDQRTAPTAIRGDVHDGNAFALGGVSGHAGLFSTLGDVCRYARALLTPGTAGWPLEESTVRQMTAEQVHDADRVRALGWLLEPRDWGPWPPGTFWHTGFTGTSILVAPAWDTAVVVLTNAVHPRRQLERFAACRAGVHRAIAERLLSERPRC